MLVHTYDRDAAALAVLRADASAACVRRLARVAGTHALALDGIPAPEPSVAGVACWTSVHPDPAGGGWRGPLRADALDLPFADESFCAVLVRFAEYAQIAPEALAPELARVLAHRGTLLVAGLHPHSLWRAGFAPARWKRALREAGLDIAQAWRCGSPWPGRRSTSNLPGWLVRGLGGVYVLEAHRHRVTAIPLRASPSAHRRVDRNRNALLPRAQRQRA